MWENPSVNQGGKSGAALAVSGVGAQAHFSPSGIESTSTDMQNTFTIHCYMEVSRPTADSVTVSPKEIFS